MVTILVGHKEPLLATVKQYKLTWFGHMTQQDTLSKTVFQGALEVDLCVSDQRKNWCMNVKKGTGHLVQDMLTIDQGRCELQACVSCIYPCVCPTHPPITGINQRTNERHHTPLTNIPIYFHHAMYCQTKQQ